MFEKIGIEKNPRSDEYYMTTEDLIIQEQKEANRRLKARIRKKLRDKRK